MQKISLTEIFGIFERVVAQNQTNQDLQLFWFFQTIWKIVKNPKIWGSRDYFSREYCCRLLKDFWSSGNPILKHLSLLKLSIL